MIRTAKEAKDILLEHDNFMHQCGCRSCDGASGYLSCLREGEEVRALVEAAYEAAECFNPACHNDCRKKLENALSQYRETAKP